MNLRLLGCIVLGVFTAHLGFFMLLVHLRPQMKLAPPRKPNFTAVSQTSVNPQTGEKTIYREITVSTKLADLPPAETSLVLRKVDQPLNSTEHQELAQSPE